MKRRTLFASAAALMLVLGVCPNLASTPALALDELRIIAPAAPGGGWDQTARAMQEAVQSGGAVKTVTVENVPGAGGTVGLAQLAGQEAGKDNVLMVNGLVMVGAILTNKSAVTLENTTPSIEPCRSEMVIIAIFSPALLPLRTTVRRTRVSWPPSMMTLS